MLKPRADVLEIGNLFGNMFNQTSLAAGRRASRSNTAASAAQRHPTQFHQPAPRFHVSRNQLKLRADLFGDLNLANSIEGTVADIGPKGQLVSDITADQLTAVPRDENTIVKFGDHATQGLYEADHGHPDATMVAFIGSSGNLEIEIVGVSLSEMLGIKPGERIAVHW